METHFSVDSARLVVSEEDKRVLRSSDVQSFLEKSSDFFSNCVTKALDMGSGSGMSSSACEKKAKRLRKASGWKSAKNPTERPLSGADIVNVNQA